MKNYKTPARSIIFRFLIPLPVFLTIVFTALFVQEALSSALNQTDYRPPKKYDASFMISATSVMQKIKQKKPPFLVDIRHKTKFNEFKIPGSINIALPFIKTKSFLKTRPIVLIHQGFAYSELIKQTKDLKKKGFDIKILKGGLAAWTHKNGKIVGSPFFQKDLNKMPVNIFFQEKDYEEWIIINACKKPSEKLKNLIPKAIHIQNPEGDIKTGDLVQAILSGKNTIKPTIHIPPKKTMTSIIIFNETGKEYEKLETRINKAFKHKVFYLKGGIKAYQKFLNNQMLANKPKSNRTKEVGHCEPCKTKDNK